MKKLWLGMSWRRFAIKEVNDWAQKLTFEAGIPRSKMDWMVLLLWTPIREMESRYRCPYLTMSTKGKSNPYLDTGKEYDRSLPVGGKIIVHTKKGIVHIKTQKIFILGIQRKLWKWSDILVCFSDGYKNNNNSHSNFDFT